ncbi:Rha family transcriptional regulator [Maridesulfovibrio frigidus]|uniref:Rha family transcriptional regulator n=1 Tax=Maridesulfovibrio frigidus TaxID=340956 RepID=UPI00068B8C32|nr:Rha family transcriptional regulator [Maridesulfovibrio frigidus]
MAGKNVANSHTSDNSSVVGSPTLVIADGKPVVSSLTIAEHFGKQHKDVLRKIELLDLPDDFGQRNFAPSSYVNAQNKKQPSFNLTRDGFAYLVMGFTGKKASAWKISYLEAFNAMEQELLQKQANTNVYIGKIEAEHPLWYNHINMFVQNECCPAPDSTISKDDIYTHYCNFCTRNNVSPVHRARLFTTLYCLTTYVRETRPRVNGKRPRILANIAITPQLEAVSKLSLRDNPPPKVVQKAEPVSYSHVPQNTNLATAKKVMLKNLEQLPRAERQAMLMAYDALIEAEHILNGEA